MIIYIPTSTPHMQHELHSNLIDIIGEEITHEIIANQTKGKPKATCARCSSSFIATKMIMGRRIGSTIIRNLATRIHTQNNNNNNSTQIPPAKPNESSFKPKDIVMRVLSDNQFEITFPVSQRVLQRSKARVHASHVTQIRN
eukprot:269350_1